MASVTTDSLSDVKIDLSIDGWMTESELIWLAERAAEHHIIVEIGCFVGRTTKALADNTCGIVFAIDTWDISWKDTMKSDPPAFDLASKHVDIKGDFMNNLKDQIIEHKVIPIQGTIADFYRRADMIFIDGDHHEEAVDRDIRNAIRRLNSGGLLCGHDYKEPIWPDVAKVVDQHFAKVDNPVGSIWCVTV